MRLDEIKFTTQKATAIVKYTTELVLAINLKALKNTIKRCT